MLEATFGSLLEGEAAHTEKAPVLSGVLKRYMSAPGVARLITEKRAAQPKESAVRFALLDTGNGVERRSHRPCGGFIAARSVWTAGLERILIRRMKWT